MSPKWSKEVVKEPSTRKKNISGFILEFQYETKSIFLEYQYEIKSIRASLLRNREQTARILERKGWGCPPGQLCLECH